MLRIPPSRIVILFISASASLADMPPDPKLYALSGPSLRSRDAMKPSLPPPEQMPTELKLSSDPTTADLAIQRAEALTGGPILTLPPPRDDPGGFYSFLKPVVVDPIANPEVIKIGKVQMTGGLIGALKRKNPLYLLNPLIFALDW